MFSRESTRIPSECEPFYKQLANRRKRTAEAQPRTMKTSPAPAGRMKIARRFNGGYAEHQDRVPVRGRLKCRRSPARLGFDGLWPLHLHTIVPRSALMQHFDNFRTAGHSRIRQVQSSPSGTGSVSRAYPPLKRRATFSRPAERDLVPGTNRRTTAPRTGHSPRTTSLCRAYGASPSFRPPSSAKAGLSKERHRL